MTAPRRWLTQETEDQVVHIVPLDDLIVHDLEEDCLCGPSAEIVLHDDAPDGHVHTHHSLDGREADEPGTSTS